ncbi:Metallo-hydrolase/oxidoreductase [Aspergillus sclerotioniger CBS 115572]|uniref:Metallo-hydrolase/oxidoreductase n=1 Tax=Aspergillus sclerotioniger CBS 115572 TaxID=1450535 RepID=A0A317VJJ6_9EURO|nr:Metallo-hydrolase/oxidoreductase [Aspergillus sclerotioniger CBS 115572]PWY74503.1 Metallo-hydrolase/oxidoreductase [Aspergillus sclerotioniger CBS 115572]
MKHSRVPFSSSVSKRPKTYLYIPEEAERTLHHVKNRNGDTIKFQNPYPSFGSPSSIFQMMSKIFKAQRAGKISQPDCTNIKLPVIPATFLTSRFNNNPSLRATWLGHACYYVEFPSGLRVLFDPVFEDRCTPVRWAGHKRLTQPPCSISHLPFIDAVVISHSHYDHLSHKSVLDIQHHHPEAHFFVGLGIADWFRQCAISNVTELDWWQDANLDLLDSVSKSIRITATFSCLPSQHSSGRTLTDKDSTLWASWAVSSGGKSVWFAGDTGYRAVPETESTDDYGPEYMSLPRCPCFVQIGRLRRPFDLGLIPIGVYKPRFLWSPLHANPRDAVEIFLDTKCRSHGYTLGYLGSY